MLIIGILAAVALPQYQKTVYKAHGTEALTAADALDKTISAYYLEHGTYKGITADTLDVQLPELKHFQYNTGCYSETGSSTFPQGGFATGNGNSMEVYLTIPNGPYVVLRWEKGNISRKIARNNAKGISSVPVDTYFNCNWRVLPGSNTPQCSLD